MGMGKEMRLPKWVWLVVILTIISIILSCFYRKPESGTDNYEPQECWNIMILVDTSGSLKELDKNNLNLDINDALTFAIKRLKEVSQKSGSIVKLGIQPFDIGISDEAIFPFSLLNNDTEETVKIQIPYDNYHRGTDLEKALNYALGVLQKEQDPDKLTRNIIIMLTDGKEAKVERSESLDEALKDERELSDELNCELFIISPNTDNNQFEGEGDLDRIEKLSADFQFGRMYFYDFGAESELDNYIVTKDANLIMKMLELVAQITSGKEIELIDKKSSYSRSQGKVIPCYEFDVENPNDTIEFFFQNVDKEDVDKIKVFKIDEEKEVYYRNERIEDNVLIQLVDIQEGRYRIETRDWPSRMDGYIECSNPELADKLLEYEEEFARKIICLRKSNYTYNIKSELIENVDKQQGESRLIDGREFNVPYLEKIVVVPVIDGKEVQDENVLRTLAKNFPYFYVKAPNSLNLWSYCTKQVDGNDSGISLSYDEIEKGFVGYVPVMNNGEYTVKICMTRGNKTDIIEYPFDCKSKIFQTKDGQHSWRYSDGFSIHLADQGELFTVGKKLWGRDITLDKENVTFQDKTIECNKNTLTINDALLPYLGKYEVHGNDQFDDNWTINGAVLVLPLRKLVYYSAAFFALLLSFWIYWVRWDCKYCVVIGVEVPKDVEDPKNVEVPRGKYLSMDVLVEHAIAQGKVYGNNDCRSVEKIFQENKKQLQKEVFVRRGIRRLNRRYEKPGSNGGSSVVGPIRIDF